LQEWLDSEQERLDSEQKRLDSEQERLDSEQKRLDGKQDSGQQEGEAAWTACWSGLTVRRRGWTVSKRG
jgi:hypothetical protein